MNTHQRCRRPGLTLVDVLVVLAVAVLLLGGLLPAAGRAARSGGSRMTCASNLRQIGLAIQMYANDHKGSFPRILWDPVNDPNPVPTAYTGANAANPFGPGGPAANDVSAALFLIARTQELESQAFNCPSDSAAKPLKGDVSRMSNFPGRQNLSYSYMNPYTSARARNAGFKLDFTLSSDFAIAADINPGAMAITSLAWDASPQWEGNSPNHRGNGQNVLYADGHVEFQSSSFCGMIRTVANVTFRDNIYYAGGPGTPSPAVVLAAAQDDKDSILLPVAPEGPTNPEKYQSNVAARRRGILVLVLAAGVLLIAAISGAFILMDRAASRRAAAAASFNGASQGTGESGAGHE